MDVFGIANNPIYLIKNIGNVTPAPGIQTIDRHRRLAIAVLENTGRIAFTAAVRLKKIVVMRLLAIILAILLFPFSMSVPSAIACSTPACCGPNCSNNAPVNQLSCCKTPVAPDRATTQARDTQHFDSVGSMPVAAVIVAISHSRNTVVASGYSPPDRLVSLALLCSRQI